MQDDPIEILGTREELTLRRRRRFLTRAMSLAAGAAGLAAVSGKTASAQGPSYTDADILNFALNLEYLEAEYYTYATTGMSIEALGIATDGVGTTGPVIIKPNPQVPFKSKLIMQYALEIAEDERTHVTFLRAAITGLGATPVARPTIDLLNSFNTLALLAGDHNGFDPFANDTNFLLGSYVFEDVGVTAYHGAAPLIVDKGILTAAAGILGTEAYHAGLIRTVLFAQNQGSQTEAISMVREVASGANDDYGVAQGPNGMSSIVLTDANALVFARTTRQVLNIVYLSPATTMPPAHAGGFFPNGLNGLFR